jgi:hypothetical protein
VIPIFTPSFANARATALPRPLPPPVMMAFFPFMLILIVFFNLKKFKKGIFD